MVIAIFDNEVLKSDFKISEFIEINPAFYDFEKRNNILAKDIKVISIKQLSCSQAAANNPNLALKVEKWAKEHKIDAVIYK